MVASWKSSPAREVRPRREGLWRPASLWCLGPGFTLIELLVVIAIIALLVGILAPTLAKVRENARSALCLSNLRQLNAALLTYHQDQRAFPFGNGWDYHGRLRHGWGGVHWYGDSDPAPLNFLPADRPLNPYIIGELRTDRHARVFQCPLDNGCQTHVTRSREWLDRVTDNTSGQGGRSMYTSAGLSYELNTWIYCKPGSAQGFGFAPATVMPPNMTANLGWQHVVVAPSHLIIMSDIGAIKAGRLSPGGRVFHDIWEGWWHGFEVGHLAMLDGSVIVERRMRTATASRYTFFLDPDKHAFPRGLTVFPELTASSR